LTGRLSRPTVGRVLLPPRKELANVTNTGPLGKERSPLAVIFFSIITLGIYYLVWVYKSQEEIKEHSGQGIGGVLASSSHSSWDSSLRS
jgi:hypothetical protein